MFSAMYCVVYALDVGFPGAAVTQTKFNYMLKCDHSCRLCCMHCQTERRPNTIWLQMKIASDSILSQTTTNVK